PLMQTGPKKISQWEYGNQNKHNNSWSKHH
ncbi:unnamed protein product, partial [marine sediment metagenome]